MSEWAERYRVLDAKSSALPGPWRNDKTPYLVGIMDEFLNYETEEIIFCKAAQVGGTEVLLNLLGYIAQQDPSPTMCVYPSDILAESVVVNRLRPMLYASKSLRERFRDTVSSKTELQFDGMFLNMVGSNSPSQLASRAIRNLFLDEVDKYPGASKKEADPISLARERTKTFRNRKIYITSTPTLKTGHIWKAMEAADQVKHYFVPCPHCGKMIELKWKQIDFPSDEGMSYADRAEFAVYICQECKGVITDRDKTDLPELAVPKWTKLLTAGVDVQENCVYWTIRAWGDYLTSQNIAHGQAHSFSEVERIMNLQYNREDGGEPMVVGLALIDSGDNTDVVYDFCANNSDWALPSKGASHPMDTHFRISKVNKTDSKAYGMPLTLIDTGKYKDMIAGRMRKKNGTGSWMVYKGCDRTYAEQVTAEHKVNVRTAGGRTVQQWALKTTHADNHYLDTEVYAMCAADMLGARFFHLEEVEVQPRTEAKPDAYVSPEENWIGQNESWFAGEG